MALLRSGLQIGWVYTRDLPVWNMPTLLSAVVAYFHDLCQRLLQENLWVFFHRVCYGRNACFLHVGSNDTGQIDGFVDMPSPAVVKRSPVLQEILHNRRSHNVVIVPVSTPAFKAWTAAAQATPTALRQLSAADFVNVMQVRFHSKVWNAFVCILNFAQLHMRLYARRHYHCFRQLI